MVGTLIVPRITFHPLRSCFERNELGFQEAILSFANAWVLRPPDELLGFDGIK